jgi:flagellar biosynthesis anti-sigma factor FlgM
MKIDHLTGADNAQQTRATDRGGPVDRTTGSGSATRSATGAGATGSGAPADTVFISGRAETLARLASQVASLPEIRQDRVDSLQQQIASGGFHPPAADIANSIIQDELRPS